MAEAQHGKLYTGAELVKLMPQADWHWSDCWMQPVFDAAGVTKHWNDSPRLQVKRTGRNEAQVLSTGGESPHEPIIRFFLRRKLR